MMPKKKSELDLWYPRYPGKYARKTATLSLSEHGAYCLLLDYYYVNGKLPLDWVHLHRICKALAPPEQAAVQTVVITYFTQTADGWVNERAEEELKRRNEISDKRRQAQAERERLKALQTGCKRGANAPTTTVTGIEGKPSILPQTVTSTVEIDMEFQKIWLAYPGRGKDGVTGNAYKGQRQAALKSFSKIYKETKEAEREAVVRNITEGCSRYEKHLDRSGYPSKHASTWLNNRGWEDDYSASGGPSSSGSDPRRWGSGQNKSDRAKDVLRKSAEDLGITRRPDGET